MFRRLGLVAVLLALSSLGAAAIPYSVEGSRITCGQARFTVLSPTLLRLEYSPKGQFVDQPTVLVLDRNFPECPFKVEEQDEWLVVDTGQLELRWLAGAWPWDDTNLMISWHHGDSSGTWRPGTKDTGDLGGTRGALDGVNRSNLPRVGDGLLSREGWTLLDDSQRPIWLGEEDWLQDRPDYDCRDWYFFAYGADYGHMLAEYVRLCGRIPMLPRYTWGPWFSRYWEYTDSDLKAIVERFRKLGIPLDVLVVDVDWHKYGWEGYDWEEKYFPDPEGFLAWVHDQGAYVTLNNHPGSPLPVEDTHHAEATRAAGLGDDAKDKPLAWDLADQKLNRAFVEAVHWPLEEMGVDFWWIDGNPAANKRGLNATMWCAKTYYDGTARRSGKRSLTFSRYGDLGQHRYPTGFSGDVYSQWEVLDYEVPFTLRAGNVAFPYWSHDIGGFMGNRLDPELYVRWCQFGALSPVLRLHSNHGIREPWEYGDEALRIVGDFFRLRHRMYPYLNTCQREVYETGMPLCRAMYMHWPSAEEAYRFMGQYMLGPNLLVAPITEPGRNGVATKQIWLPEGLWWDYWTGEPLQGPRVMAYQAPLDRCPIFARAGAIVPMQPDMDYMGQKPADPLTVHIWPGGNGSLDLYEDDGMSMDYTGDAFTRTPISVSQSYGDLSAEIAPRAGAFEGAPGPRCCRLVFHGVDEPRLVKADGEIVAVHTGAGDDAPLDRAWARYSQEDALLTVNLPGVDPAKGIKLAVTGAADGESQARRVRLKVLLTCAENAGRVARDGGLPPDLTACIDGLRESCRSAMAGTVDEDAPLRALREAWQALASATGQDDARHTAMSALIGLNAHSAISAGADERARRVRVTVSSSFSLPGAELALTPMLPPGWIMAGQADGALTLFDRGAGGTLEFAAVALQREQNPPVGLLPFGAVGTVAWAGGSLPVRAITGLDCTFVQQWRIIGPFSNRDGGGLETVYEPETNLDVARNYSGMDGEAKWVKTGWRLPDTSGDAPVFINLEPLITPKDKAIAYAVTYLVAERDMDAVLWVGTDDGCKVWLNGDLVLSHPEPRPPDPGQDQVPVSLRRGRNTVLYKVANEFGQWGLYLQVLGPDGAPLNGLTNTIDADG